MFSRVLTNAEVVYAVQPKTACAPFAAVRGAGRSHQNGETVTRLVITNLVRPETGSKPEESTEFSQFSPHRTPPRPTVVRSRPGTSMPGSPGGFRSIRCSSLNPQPFGGQVSVVRAFPAITV